MSIEFNNQDEERVSKVLASLPHVKPPGDFDVRVRSRIAAGKPADSRSWLWPILAGATPLVLLVVIGLYFIAPQRSTVEPEVVAKPTSDVLLPADRPSNETPPLVVEATPDASNSERSIAKAVDVDGRPVAPTEASRGPNAGGSFDQAINERSTINPRGIAPGPRQAPRPTDFDNVISIPIKDVLTQLGAESQGMPTGMKVVSVSENGAAKRLGLRANDVIESIDEKPVNDKTSYKGKFAGKKMKVVRDGQTVEIDLSKP